MKSVNAVLLQKSLWLRLSVAQAVGTISTLWLNSILGDGTLTALIILVAMIGIPILLIVGKANAPIEFCY